MGAVVIKKSEQAAYQSQRTQIMMQQNISPPQPVILSHFPGDLERSIVSTMNGYLHCIDTRTGRILWTHKGPRGSLLRNNKDQLENLNSIVKYASPSISNVLSNLQQESKTQTEYMVEPSTGLLYQFVQDGNLLVVGGLVAILFNNVEITILDK